MRTRLRPRFATRCALAALPVVAILSTAITTTAATAATRSLRVEVSPQILSPNGGWATVTASVKGESKCWLKMTSHPSFPVIYSHNPRSCTSGHFTAHIRVFGNPSDQERAINFELLAAKKSKSLKSLFDLVLAAGETRAASGTTTSTTGTTTTTTSPTTTTSTTTTVPPYSGSPSPGATTTTTASPTTTTTVAPAAGALAISSVTLANNVADNTETISVSPVNKGDLVLVGISLDNGATVRSISGGGVSGWTKEAGATYPGVAGDVELWAGVFTDTTAIAPITLSVNGTYTWDEMVVQEFTTGTTNPFWSVDKVGSAPSGNVDVSFPSLSPTSGGELYFGYAYVVGDASAPTSTPIPTGLGYATTLGTNLLCWDTDVSSPLSPPAGLDATQPGVPPGSISVAGLFSANSNGAES